MFKPVFGEIKLSERDDKNIKKRAIFFIGGFDPKSPKDFFGKLNRETERFEKLWDVSVTADEIKSVSSDVACTRYNSKSNNTSEQWTVKTDFHFLTLDDIVLKDFNRPFFTRFWRYTKTLANYVFSGTAFAFIKHAWRFSLYFFYPMLMIFIAMLLSLVPAMMVANMNIPFAWLLAIPVFLGFFILCGKLGGNRYHVLHLMDLWSFSADFIKGDRQDINQKLDSYSDIIAEQVSSTHYDEVLLIGHSTGGALILDVAGRASERHKGYENNCDAISILTLGSTALKIGLHPKASKFRQRVKTLFSQPKYKWIEYQCLTDVINFFRTDPAKLMGVDTKPIIRTIRVKEMLDKTTYARIKRNFFRVHYQFVFGNTKPNHFDFPAICFGPAPILKRATEPHLFMNNLNCHSETERAS
ncbi:MAG: lipase [Rhizobiaceae bacterium]